MKNLLSNGVLILLVLGGLYVFYLRECKSPKENMHCVEQSVWDSIVALSHKKPDTIVKHDTIRGAVVYIPHQVPAHQADPTDSTINYYKDSLIEKDIDVGVDLVIKGSLLSINWRYRPVLITHDSLILIYVPQSIDNPVPVIKSGFYIYSAIGGNVKTFVTGAGLFYITKKNTVIGYEYNRIGAINVHSIKFGIKLGK